MIEIKVFDITGSRAVLDSPDGDTLFYQILENFKAGERVILNFEKVETILSMFLNSAIAPLYEQYDSNFLNEHLVIKNMSEDDKITLKRVNSRAKQFYKEAKENSDLCMEEVYGE
ncbi:STAS-like domain-containing protein [Lachnospiraceae bacterium 38-14]